MSKTKAISLASMKRILALVLCALMLIGLLGDFPRAYASGADEEPPVETAEPADKTDGQDGGGDKPDPKPSDDGGGEADPPKETAAPAETEKPAETELPKEEDPDAASLIIPGAEPADDPDVKPEESKKGSGCDDCGTRGASDVVCKPVLNNYTGEPEFPLRWTNLPGNTPYGLGTQIVAYRDNPANSSAKGRVETYQFTNYKGLSTKAEIYLPAGYPDSRRAYDAVFIYPSDGFCGEEWRSYMNSDLFVTDEYSYTGKDFVDFMIGTGRTPETIVVVMPLYGYIAGNPGSQGAEQRAEIVRGSDHDIRLVFDHIVDEYKTFASLTPDELEACECDANMRAHFAFYGHSRGAVIGATDRFPDTFLDNPAFNDWSDMFFWRSVVYTAYYLDKTPTPGGSHQTVCSETVGMGAEYEYTHNVTYQIVALYNVFVVLEPCDCPEPPDDPAQAYALKTSTNPSMTNGNSNYSLAEAEFKVYASEDDAGRDRNPIGEPWVTGSNGKTSPVKLEPGTYWLKETKAPKGFELNNTPVPFTVIAGETTAVEIADKPKGDPISVLLYKYKKGTNGQPDPTNPLADAEFTVKFYYTKADADADTNVVRTWKFKTNAQGAVRPSDAALLLPGSDAIWTDDNGSFTLPIGAVAIKETKAPDNFREDSTRRVYEITEAGIDGNSTPFVNAPMIPNTELGSLEITKTAEDGVKADFKFKVTGPEYPNGRTFTTDANGKITLTDIETGSYTIEEVDVKGRYVVPTPQIITVEWKTTASASFENKLRTITVTTKKTDVETGSATAQGDAVLDGAVYGLYKQDGTEVARGAITGGQYTFTGVPVGKYYIQEITPPTGYTLSTEKIPFEIKASDLDDASLSNVDQTAKETVQKGSLKILKVDIKTGEPYQGDAKTQGIRFALVNASANAVQYKGATYAKGTIIDILTIGANGEASTPANSVPYGTYTIYELRKDATIAAGDTYAGSGKLGSSPLANDSYLFEAFSDTISVRANGTTYTFARAADSPVPAGAGLQKVDSDAGTAQGDANLKDIEYAIVNRSAKEVYVGDTPYAVGDVVMIVKTDANGHFATSNKALPYGTYDIVELKVDHTAKVGEPYSAAVLGSSKYANTHGYLWKAQTKQVVLHTYNQIEEVTFDNNVARGGADIIKVDAETTTPQGDADLSDIEYAIVNRSAKEVVVNGTKYAPGKIVMIVKTGADGKFSTSNRALPYGTYDIVEMKLNHSATVGATYADSLQGNSIYANNHGYLWKAQTQHVELREDGQVAKATFSDTVARGGADIQKKDAENTSEQGDASFADISYAIVNRSVNPVTVGGVNCAVGDVVMIVKTDANGHFATSNRALPYGTYDVVELKIDHTAKVGEPYSAAVLGSSKYANTHGYLWAEQTQTITIRKDAEVKAVEFQNEVVRGAFALDKVDMDTWQGKPLGGAKLSNAEITITNISEHEVIVNGRTYAPGEIVMTIVTDENGLATTGERALPYGTYLAQEIAAPEGYNLNEEWLHMFSIREDGETVQPEGEQKLADLIKRGDFHFDKRELGTERPLANVVFKVTSLTTGEWHLIVTDENGMYASNLFERDAMTNANDAALNEDGSIDESKLDASYGTWFAGAVAPDPGSLIDNDRGALPYDRYEIEELRTSANEGLKLIKFTHRIGAVEGSDLDLGSFKDDNEPEPIFVTKADITTHEEVPGAKLQILDRKGRIFDEWTSGTAPRRISGLISGQIYTLREIIAPDGYAVTTDTTFTIMDNGKLDVGATTTSIRDDGDGLVLLVEDDLTRVSIKKVDIFSEEELPGATLQVIDAAGHVVDEWVSTEEAHDIFGLLTGVDYTLRETIAPDDYTLTVDTIFRLNPDGTVDAEHTTTTVNADGVLLVEDAPTPELKTSLHDEAGSQETEALETVTLIDDVHYNNVVTGKEYTVKGVLMDKATGEPLLDKNGEEITSEITFVPEESAGTVSLTFTFECVDLAGKTVVAFEDLYRDKIKVAVHADLDDQDQTVTFPKIRTTLLAENGEHISVAAENVTLTDIVRYENLIPGNSYTLTGTLMDKATGKPLTGADDEPITAETTFVPEEANGEVEVVFEIDASQLAGTSTVAFETLHNGVGIVARHEDLNDKDQEVEFPEIKTTLHDKDNEHAHEVLAQKTVTLIDDVQYSKLTVGKEYTVNGVLMDKATGEPMLDAEGNEITASTTFTAESTDGIVSLTFTFPGVNMAGKTVVAFEDMYYEDILVGVHADLEDEDQTVWFPKIGTTATVDGAHEALAAEEVTLVDLVAYENLQPGREYELRGTLMDKATGETAKDADGNDITASTVFTPEEADGEVEVVFVFDASAFAGHDVVVFESLYRDKIEVAVHADIEDENQTVTFPEIRTTATVDGSHSAPVAEEVEIVDRVSYTKLIVGKTYVVSGVLMDKAAGEPLLNAEGEPYTTEIEFTPEEADGYVELTFVVNAADLAGETIVAFETLYRDEKEIAFHRDLGDKEQTLYFPEIGTTATDTSGSKEIPANGVVEIVDVVAYKNLVPGTEYTMRGTAVNKATGEPVMGPDGKPATAELTFTPETADGTVELFFAVNASELAGEYVVVFESLYLNEVELIVHADLEDEDQTVWFPKIKTTLMDAAGQHVARPTGKITLTDTVEYSNLTPGKTYRMEGMLMRKSNGKVLKDEDKDPITASIEFVADESGSGTVELSFTFDASLLAGETVVAFERLYRDKIEVAVHADIEDEDQSVHFPTLHTTATSADGEKVVRVDSEDAMLVVVDRVTYTNLVPGETYTLSGVLMNKLDGSVVRLEDGKAYVATLEFTPETADGYVDVTFELPAKNLPGKTLVVFETLMLGKETVMVHEDINDVAQTIMVTWRTKSFKYDAATYEGIEGVTFEVRDLTDKDAPLQTVTTDKDGFFQFDGAPGHEFAIREIKAPAGYNFDSKREYFVTVQEDGTLTGDTEIQNIRGGTVIISKVDFVTGTPVEGCEIAIYDKDHKEICKRTTDKDGRIYFYTPDPGEYYYKETATVTGYYLNEDEYKFTVADDLTVTGDTRFKNIPFGTVVITKLNEKDEPLAGAEISVYDANGKFLGKGVSNDKGRVYFVSPGPGKYYFVETAAPQGYQIDNEKHWFEIGEDYTITGTVKLKNERKPSPPTKTGDESHIGLWLTIAGISLIGVCCAGCFLWKRPRRKDDTETAGELAVDDAIDALDDEVEIDPEPYPEAADAMGETPAE